MRPDQARTLAEIFDDENIGSAIAKIRRSLARQSQAQFANSFGLSREQLANIEIGRTAISADLGWQLCRKYNVHPRWLMWGGPPGEPERLNVIPADEIEFLERQVAEHKAMKFRQFWKILGAIVAGGDEKKKNQLLTHYPQQGKTDGVKPILPKLIERLRKATKERGRKTELAAWLGVSPQKVTDWLSARVEPSGETTLRLLHWVEQAERPK